MSSRNRTNTGVVLKAWIRTNTGVVLKALWHAQPEQNKYGCGAQSLVTHTAGTEQIRVCCSMPCDTHSRKRTNTGVVGAQCLVTHTAGTKQIQVWCSKPCDTQPEQNKYGCVAQCLVTHTAGTEQIRVWWVLNALWQAQPEQNKYGCGAHCLVTRTAGTERNQVWCSMLCDTHRLIHAGLAQCMLFIVQRDLATNYKLQTRNDCWVRQA